MGRFFKALEIKCKMPLKEVHDKGSAFMMERNYLHFWKERIISFLLSDPAYSLSRLLYIVSSNQHRLRGPLSTSHCFFFKCHGDYSHSRHTRSLMPGMIGPSGWLLSLGLSDLGIVLRQVPWDLALDIGGQCTVIQPKILWNEYLRSLIAEK